LPGLPWGSRVVAFVSTSVQIEYAIEPLLRRAVPWPHLGYGFWITDTTETFRNLAFSNRMPGTFHTRIPNRASPVDRRDSRCEYRVERGRRASRRLIHSRGATSQPCRATLEAFQ